MDNPLLAEPLRPEQIKPRLLGHWGTTPGLNFIWTHLSRVITLGDLNMMIVIGPGHGGPAALANCWLEGSYSQIYPSVSRDAAGMARLMRQFSFPGGVPSHVAAETPGSIHEGGELGYSLSHAFGAAFDNPDLLVACVVGDGEAETGPLATSWHSNKFLDPATDGAVLPILHLNGYKIANPALLARIGDDELDALLRGFGYEPAYVSGDDPMVMHEQMAATVDAAVGRIRQIWSEARTGADSGSGARGGGTTAGLADDRAALAQGVDRPCHGRRAPCRGHLAISSGTARRGQDEPGAPAAARGVAALLRPRRAVRLRRPPAP